MEGPDTATLSFDTGVLHHRASLGEVRRQPVTVPGPGIDTRLVTGFSVSYCCLSRAFTSASTAGDCSTR